MNQGLIAVRYADAMFKLAIENKIGEEVYEDFNILMRQCLQVDDFCSFLDNPIIKPSHKKNLFQTVFKDKIHPMTLKFLEVVLDHKREDILTFILNDFIYHYKKSKGIKSVLLYTAVGLDERYLLQIEEFLEKEFKSPVEMEVKVKSDLLGGFILTVEGKMVDASISNRLKQVRMQLLK
ncbi:ATP synthase F1 subunit delta [Marinilabiliaceae bacterium JC017]|nr:ATP synthase F1 subunit delta [Marinilabiliaceae bacterium JC017]